MKAKHRFETTCLVSSFPTAVRDWANPEKQRLEDFFIYELAFHHAFEIGYFPTAIVVDSFHIRLRHGQPPHGWNETLEIEVRGRYTPSLIGWTIGNALRLLNRLQRRLNSLDQSRYCRYQQPRHLLMVAMTGLALRRDRTIRVGP